MTEKKYDILIIGATGYTGRLVIEYLASHLIVNSLRIALGGRTLHKVEELANHYKNFQAVHLDTNNEDSVLAAVAATRVVINLAGPYWSRGSVVVRACALYGAHYVDLAGEPPWLAEIIADYDYLAYKSGACIVPCSGFDSIPSDLASYLALQTLEKQISASGESKPLNITSTTAFRLMGGVSGGTVGTLFEALEVVPPEKRQAGSGWGLSPIPPPPAFSGLPKFLYTLPLIRPTVHGGFWPMATVNEPIVRRSWGLRERQRREETTRSASSLSAPTFSYTEFLATPGPISSILLSLGIFFIGISLALLPPVRWVAKKFLPKSGEGPSPEALKKGWFELTNVTEGGGVAAKSVVKGNGDPGYELTSIMITECALLLLDTSKLTLLAKQGGILTPTAAFGDKLAQTLEATGRFETSSEVLVQGESKKTR